MGTRGGGVDEVKARWEAVQTVLARLRFDGDGRERGLAEITLLRMAVKSPSMLKSS